MTSLTSHKTPFQHFSSIPEAKRDSQILDTNKKDPMWQWIDEQEQNGVVKNRDSIRTIKKWKKEGFVKNGEKAIIKTTLFK